MVSTCCAQFSRDGLKQRPVVREAAKRLACPEDREAAKRDRQAASVDPRQGREASVTRAQIAVPLLREISCVSWWKMKVVPVRARDYPSHLGM